MSFYSDLAATADKLIADKGQTVTLTKYIRGSFDASGTSSGSYGSNTTSVMSVSAVELGAVRKWDNMFDEALARDKRKIFYISAKKPDGSALDYEPVVGCTIQSDSGLFYIVGVSEINPAGTPVVYVVGARL